MAEPPENTPPLAKVSQLETVRPIPIRLDGRYVQVLSRRCVDSAEETMAQHPRLVRQWILLRTLCARHHGATVKELAETLGASIKTVRRDLEIFQQAGFPLEETVCQYGLKKWRIDPEKNQPGLSFTFDEAIALYLGRHLLEPLAGTVFWDAAQRALKKIRATLGTEALRYVERFGQIFYQTMVGTSDYSKKAEIIDQLVQGIEDRRAVFITYRSLRATESVTYDIFPYGLVYHRGSLYVVGWGREQNEIRHWKVNRIEEAEVTAFPFKRPADFDLHEHLAKSFGVFHGDGEVHVKVRFSKTVARYVQESHWHASQKLSPQKDGSLVAEFDLDSTEEIKRWVLSFGRHAEVVEPEELREDIAEELHTSLSLYRSDRISHGRRTRTSE